MIRRPPRSTQSRSSAASDVYKRQTVLLIFEDIQHGHQVFGGDIAGNRMRGRCNVSSTWTHDGEGFLRFRSDLLRRGKGEQPLGADAAIESQILSKFFFHSAEVINLRLERLI